MVAYVRKVFLRGYTCTKDRLAGATLLESHPHFAQTAVRQKDEAFQARACLRMTFSSTEGKRRFFLGFKA